MIEQKLHGPAFGVQTLTLGRAHARLIDNPQQRVARGDGLRLGLGDLQGTLRVDEHVGTEPHRLSAFIVVLGTPERLLEFLLLGSVFCEQRRESLAGRAIRRGGVGTGRSRQSQQ